MQSSPQEHEKEIEFCQFMEYIFSEEPCHIEYKFDSATISFFIYHNEQSPDVFDMLSEFDHNWDCYELKDYGWRDSSVRLARPTGAIAQHYGFGLLFESVNQNCIDLFVNCDNMATYLHV